MAVPEERIEIEHSRGSVSGMFAGPGGAPGVLVVAHGAGGNMHGPFLVGFTRAMNEAGVATLRFNFRYSEQGRRSPDAEGTLRDVWLAAFDAATARAAGAPVFAGGKSLGGRIASMCVADGMPAAGLVFLGYPLHPPGRPERLRDAHLGRIEVPMLFLQGTADPFARWDLLEAVVGKLGDRARLHAIEGGDHSFRVRGARADDRSIGADLAAVAAPFVQEVAAGG